VFSTPRVEVKLNTTIEDAYGNGVLQGLKTKNVSTGEVSDLGVAGLFYGIGHKPNSDLIKGQVELDEVGYVKVRGWGGAQLGCGRGAGGCRVGASPLCAAGALRARCL
jgi:thioredoxin reductase